MGLLLMLLMLVVVVMWRDERAACMVEVDFDVRRRLADNISPVCRRLHRLWRRHATGVAPLCWSRGRDRRCRTPTDALLLAT